MTKMRKMKNDKNAPNYIELRWWVLRRAVDILYGRVFIILMRGEGRGRGWTVCLYEPVSDLLSFKLQYTHTHTYTHKQTFFSLSVAD